MILARRQFLVFAGATVSAPTTYSLAWAQTNPGAVSKFIVPYPAGGTGDMVARLIAEKLRSALAESIVVENRAGASGAIGARAVVSSAPDGHTLLVGHTGEIAINPHWVNDIGYDPHNDLLPVAFAVLVPLALVVPATAPYATVGELLNFSKVRGLSFASAGAGTPGHLAGEMLKLKANSNLTHVPYKGAPPALNDLLGGHVDLFFSGFPAALPHVKAGVLKLLAVSSRKRSSIAPDVPTVAESAHIPEFDITLWVGFFAPRGTSEARVLRLNAEINRILDTPDIKQKLLEQGADVMPMSVERLATFVRSEGKKFQDLIKAANLAPQ